MHFNVKENTTLGDFLLKVMHGISRTAVKQMLSRRQVFVNGKTSTVFNSMLEPDMHVEINKRQGGTYNPGNNLGNMLKIIYEDDYIIVADKKEGLLSVAANGTGGQITAHSLLNGYIKENPDYVKKNRFAQEARVFIVHRLDRDTSGLMVFAKDRHTKSVLQQNWDEIVTERGYVALTEGEISREKGCITSWLTDSKAFITYSSRTDNGGKKAITHYKVIKKERGMSLVELNLETGRKNQIRVHMQDIGHPIIGDVKYGGIKSGRLHLHAFKLAFKHPATGKQLDFSSKIPFSI